MRRRVCWLGHNGDVKELWVRIHGVHLSAAREDFLHIVAKMIAVLLASGGLITADGTDIVLDRAAHGHINGFACRNLPHSLGSVHPAFFNAKNDNKVYRDQPDWLRGLTLGLVY